MSPFVNVIDKVGIKWETAQSAFHDSKVAAAKIKDNKPDLRQTSARSGPVVLSQAIELELLRSRV